MKLFEYALILHPTEDEKKAGQVSKLVNGGIEHVLAGSEEQAVLMAGRSIPEDLLDKLDRMEVAVRPF